MELLSPALAERVNACSNRCIRLMGLQPDEAEKIGLLAAILGSEIEPHDAVGRGVGRVRSSRQRVQVNRFGSGAVT